MARFTLINVQADHILEATFKALVALFTITVNAGPGGTVSPGTTQVAGGTDITFEITPDAGMMLDKITLDGTEVSPDPASLYKLVR